MKVECAHRNEIIISGFAHKLVKFQQVTATLCFQDCLALTRLLQRDVDRVDILLGELTTLHRPFGCRQQFLVQPDQELLKFDLFLDCEKFSKRPSHLAHNAPLQVGDLRQRAFNIHARHALLRTDASADAERLVDTYTERLCWPSSLNALSNRPSKFQFRIRPQSGLLQPRFRLLNAYVHCRQFAIAIKRARHRLLQRERLLGEPRHARPKGPWQR